MTTTEMETELIVSRRMLGVYEARLHRRAKLTIAIVLLAFILGYFIGHG